MINRIYFSLLILLVVFGVSGFALAGCVPQGGQSNDADISGGTIEMTEDEEDEDIEDAESTEDAEDMNDLENVEDVDKLGGNEDVVGDEDVEEVVKAEDIEIEGADDQPNNPEYYITARNFEFSVEELRVKKFDTITIKLTSEEGYHGFAIDELHVQTDFVQAGETTEVTFVPERVGEFEFYCPVGGHRELGMIGRFIVEE